MRKNIILIPDKFINQSNLIQFNSFELKLLFNSFKKQRQNYKKSEEKKIDAFIAKLDDVEFIQIKKEANNHILINIDQDYRDIRNGFCFNRYTVLNIGIINKLKKKKAILLYIFVQKELKKPDKQQAKALNVPKSKLVKFTDYRNLTTLDTLIAEINAVNNKQSVMYEYDNKNKSFLLILEDLITKTTHKRSLIDDAEKELSKVSDEKLEKMFLDIATEIIKRNGGDNGVNAVGMLKDIKKNKEQAPTTYAGAIENINKENDTNKLLIKHSQLEFLMEKIDRKLEFIDSVAYAKAVESENYNEWQAKKEFNSVVPNINQAIKELKKPENETTVQLLENIEDEVDKNMLNYGTVQLEMDVNPYTLSDFDLLEDLKLIKVIRANNEKVQLLTDAGVKFRRPSNLVSVLEKVEKHDTVIVTENMLPDFTPDTSEYETLDARAG